jgi:hypothetical protein
MTRCGLEASSTGFTKRGLGCGRRHGYAAAAELTVDGCRREVPARVVCRPIRYADDGSLRWRSRWS